ncbi:putative membrane protein [Flavobacterium sp. PL11]|nr:putative membrane protein [Flavobacterium sp. PL11]
MLWILANIYILVNKGFDPYPFILLNLILSCLAALKAPVIMMSQNRQEEKDRERAKKDYMINLKSELEIRMLHEKLDHLIMHQQEELIEIQKVQIDMMNDILTRMK